MDVVDLGKQLQRARQAAGLTQQELCSKASLSYSTLAKIERGAIKAPSIFTIRSIAEALDTTLDNLIGGVGSKTADSAVKKVSKSGVKFVYFDINGCLVHFFQRAFVSLSAMTGAPADAIETTFWHYNDAVCRGEMSMDEFNRVLAERLGIDSIDWSEHYLDAVEPIEGMQELLEWASQHYYVGLLSNIMPEFINKLMARKLLPQITYDSIIDSSVAGAIKPEAKIYEIAQAHTGVSAHEILLVDDSRANIMAAERMGWHVLWFDDYRMTESISRVRAALET